MSDEKMSPDGVLESVRTESDVETVLDVVERAADALMRDIELPEDGASSATGAGQLTKVASKVNHRHGYYSLLRLAVVRRSREAGRTHRFLKNQLDVATARIMTTPEVLKGKNAEARKGLALDAIAKVELADFGGEGDAPLLHVEVSSAEERADQWVDVEKFLAVVSDRLKMAKELGKQQVNLAVGDRGYDD